MAAWTLPHRITDWCENLTTALDHRSRKYFVTVVLGMVLATGRRMVSSWLPMVLYGVAQQVTFKTFLVTYPIC